MGATLNYAKGINSGEYKIHLGDDNLYEFDWPDVCISDLLSGDPHYHFSGKISLKNAKNKLVSRIEFIEDKKKGWFGKESQEPRNQIKVGIFKQVETSEIPVVEGAGMWTRYLEFEGQTYWRHTDPVDLFVDERLEEPSTLPSSSLHRKELGLIAERKFADADKIIENVELLEDRDAANRLKKKKIKK